MLSGPENLGATLESPQTAGSVPGHRLFDSPVGLPASGLHRTLFESTLVPGLVPTP